MMGFTVMVLQIEAAVPPQVCRGEAPRGASLLMCPAGGLAQRKPQGYSEHSMRALASRLPVLQHPPLAATF